MPRFFFDVEDGEVFNSDEEGSDLDNLDRIQEQSFDILYHALKHGLAKAHSRRCSVKIRNEKGNDLYQATLSFTEEYIK